MNSDFFEFFFFLFSRSRILGFCGSFGGGKKILWKVGFCGSLKEVEKSRI